MGKSVAFLVEQDFEDGDLAEPLRAMKDMGAEVVLIGTGSHDVFRGKRGNISVRADTTVDAVRPVAFDAVIIPGGQAPEKMRLYPRLVDFVRQCFQQGAVVAAIGHGSQLLISAEVVRGHTVTCSPAIAVDVRNAGGNYVDEPLVRDGNLITAQSGADLGALVTAIAEALGGAREASC